MKLEEGMSKISMNEKGIREVVGTVLFFCFVFKLVILDHFNFPYQHLSSYFASYNFVSLELHCVSIYLENIHYIFYAVPVFRFIFLHTVVFHNWLTFFLSSVSI